MNTGFRPLPVDTGFARRSAKYLSAQGYRPRQIYTTLVSELDVSTAVADDILEAIAA